MEAAVSDRTRPPLGGKLPFESVKKAPPIPEPPKSARLTVGQENSERGLRDLGPASASRDLTFDELVDVINPFHHLPVINSLYRDISGDEISGSARLLGSLIYGGPVGLLASMGHVVSEETNGKDLTENLVAWVLGDEDEGTAPTAVAGQRDPSDVTDLQNASASALLSGDNTGEVSIDEVTPPSSQNLSAAIADEQPLTGLAALQAFASDLQNHEPAGKPLESNPGHSDIVDPAIIASLRPSDTRLEPDDLSSGQRVPAGRTLADDPVTATDLVRAEEVPQSNLKAHDLPVGSLEEMDFAQKMLLALDKYQTLTQQRDLEEETSSLVE